MLRETAQSKERILADAKEAAQRETQKMVEEAQKQIRRERETAIAEIRSQVATMAVDIAEKILRGELKDKDRQTELANRLLDEVQREQIVQ